MSEATTTDDPGLLATIRADIGATRGLAAVAAVVMLAWITFQWGFGNDALLPTFVSRAFDAVDDGESWGSGVTAVVAAGLVGAAFWAVTQTIDAVVVLTGAGLLPRTVERLGRSLRSKGWVTPWSEMSWSTRWGIAYLAGASAVALVDVLATGTPGVARRRPMIATAVVLSAGTVGLVSALVAAAAMIALRIPATEGAAEVFIRIAKNPFTWLGLFGAIFLIGRLRSSGDPAPTEPGPPDTSST